MLQPQTAAEHQEDINDSSSSSSDSSVSSPSSSPSESENEDVDSDYDLSEKTGGASLSDRRRRVSSRGSMQSLNFTSVSFFEDFPQIFIFLDFSKQKAK